MHIAQDGMSECTLVFVLTWAIQSIAICGMFFHVDTMHFRYRIATQNTVSPRMSVHSKDYLCAYQYAVAR